MKYAAVMVALVLLCGVSLAGEQKVAVVDMTKLLRIHPETEQAEVVLEEQVKQIDAEKRKLVDKLSVLRDDVEALAKQAQNRALSEKKRDEIRREAEKKYQVLRKQEFETKRTLDSRRKDLAEQKLRMHKRIVGEISDTVREYAEKKGYSVVLNSAGVGVSGMPAVIYADSNTDLTKEIEKLLLKKD